MVDPVQLTSESTYFQPIRNSLTAARWEEIDRDRLAELVDEAIDRFREDWPGVYANAVARSERLIGHLRGGLAIVLSDRWSYDSDDENAPFWDEESALRWLQGEGDHDDAPTPVDWFGVLDQWEQNPLWTSLRIAEDELDNLHQFDRVREKWHWARVPETPSRWPLPLQELVYSLCVIWGDYIDDRIGLPSKDPNPDNPLLRFLDASLGTVMGEGRPTKAEVLNQVAKHFKPAILRERLDNPHRGHSDDHPSFSTDRDDDIPF